VLYVKELRNLLINPLPAASCKVPDAFSDLPEIYQGTGVLIFVLFIWTSGRKLS